MKSPASKPSTRKFFEAGGGMHLRFHAPMQVISTIGDVMQQFRDAQEQGDEGDGDDMKKDEKPRF